MVESPEPTSEAVQCFWPAIGEPRPGIANPNDFQLRHQWPPDPGRARQRRLRNSTWKSTSLQIGHPCQSEAIDARTWSRSTEPRPGPDAVPVRCAHAPGVDIGVEASMVDRAA